MRTARLSAIVTGRARGEPDSAPAHAAAEPRATAPNRAVFSRDRRRQVFFDELQHRLLLVNIGYFSIVLAIFVAALFGPLVARLLDPASTMLERESVASQFFWLDQSIWVPLFLTFVGLGAHSVLVSHRIAGPLYQLRRVLSAVADGDLTVRATLRKKDYLRKEEAVVNDLVQALNARLSVVDDQTAGIVGCLGRLESSLEAGSTDRVLADLRQVRAHTAALEAVLREFTTQPGAPLTASGQAGEPD